MCSAYGEGNAANRASRARNGCVLVNAKCRICFCWLGLLHVCIFLFLFGFPGKERVFTFDFSYNSYVDRDDDEYASQGQVWSDIGAGVLLNAYDGACAAHSITTRESATNRIRLCATALAAVAVLSGYLVACYMPASLNIPKFT